MGRKLKPEFKPNPEAEAALDRILDISHQLTSELTGEPLTRDGTVEGYRSIPLVNAMMYFLLLIPHGDLHALFFTEGSLKNAACKPYKPGCMKRDPLLPMFRN